MIIIIYLLFIFFTVIGIILLKSLTNERKAFVLVPAGMVLGTGLYIFLLNWFSKIFPGQSGIIISTVTLILIGITTVIFNRSQITKFEKPNLINIILFLGLTILVIYLARLKMTSVFPVADSDMQWAYAASFARGNNPVKVPWQADLNPTYHLGAYFLEGALLSLSGLPLITIHALLNTYFLIAGALFAIFLIWEYKDVLKNVWLFLTAIILYISFGVIILAFPNQNFLKSSNIFSDTFLTATQLPLNTPGKGIAGASLVDLNLLSYLPARSLSIGLAFLGLYFTFTTFKNPKFKILSFVLLFSVIALVEESMFLPIFLTLLSIYIFSFMPFSEELRKYRPAIFLILAGTLVMIVFQGGFVSDLLDQSRSAFSFILPFSQAFIDKLFLMKTYIAPSISPSFNLLIPNPVLISLITLTYSLFSRNKILSIISLYSLIAFFCYLSVQYIYAPSSSIRFHSFSYISAGLGISFLIFFLMKTKSYLQNFLLLLIVTTIMTPSFVPEVLIQTQQIKEARLKSNRSHIIVNTVPSTPFERISTWSNKNLPPNTRILSIDTDLPTPKRSIQLQYKGFYTILGPQYIHTTRPEPAPEYFDLILTLNPSLLKQTKTDYIYIESESDVFKDLPQFRKEDLENSYYFQKMQSVEVTGLNGQNPFYRIYKVLPLYLDPKSGGKEITKGTIESLRQIIPSSSSVYISDYGDNLLSFWYRMALVLGLKDKKIIRNISQTDYQAIEANIPHIDGRINDQKYDFYILGQNQKPPANTKLIWSNIYAAVWK